MLIFCPMISTVHVLQLDVNNSPLALLAQTCSSIGKDPGPSSKPSSGSASDKKPSHASSSSSGAKESSNGARAKSESPSGKNSINGEERSKSRPSGGDKKDSGGVGGQRSGSKGTPPKTGFRVPPAPPKEASTGNNSDRLNPDSASSGSSASESGHSSRDGLSGRTLGGSSGGSGGGGKPPGTGNTCSNMLLELNQEALNKSSLHGSLHPLYSSLKDSLQALHGSLGPSLGGCTLPFLGYPLSLDPLAAYSASLAAHCNGLAGLTSSQKSPAAPGVSTTPCSAAASLSPYVSYARVKTANGGTTLVQVCKDPYCTNCQVALHGAQLGTQTPCTGPGCSQCAQHGKTSPTSLASPAPPTGLPFFPGAGGVLPSLCSHAAFTSASALASSPHGGPLVTPYVCNWVQGNEYCGKRFASSEELLQHLRSHTSTAEALVSPFNAAAAAGIPLSALGFPLGGLFGCPSLSPGLLSTPSYPRSLSPNTLLAAARYHPYKPPSLSILPGSSGPILSGAFPSLAAYYSPYAFYGQRLGAATAGP